MPRKTVYNWCLGFFSALLAGLVLTAIPVYKAIAIPSFARQTGLPCTSCHTIYPQLTAFGREFKVNGYTLGDGPFYGRISAWAQGSFTHTEEDQSGGAAPGFGVNNNFAFDQGSFFFGGKIIGKVGAFLQGTYDGVERVWGWDNMDIRFADQTSLAGAPLVYGASVNNNPGVQDLWNTTPVWGFPFDSSPLAPAPAAATLIEGGLGQVSVGATAYGLWNNQVYVEAGIYHILSQSVIDALTGSADGVPKSDGVAPYWRLAWQQESGSQSLELGTFGLHAALYPNAIKIAGSDTFTDIGFDLQHQYFFGNSSITSRLAIILEFQNLDASFALGGADRHTGNLQTLNGSVNYVYDNTVGLTAGLTHIWGAPDAAFYGTPTGSPNSTAITLQADWLPLANSPFKFYPWFDPRFSTQYIHYFQFDGNGGSANDNDTLFLLMTLTF